MCHATHTHTHTHTHTSRNVHLGHDSCMMWMRNVHIGTWLTYDGTWLWMRYVPNINVSCHTHRQTTYTHTFTWQHGCGAVVADGARAHVANGEDDDEEHDELVDCVADERAQHVWRQQLLYVYKHIYIYIYICIYAHIHAYIYVCIYIYMYMCIYVYIYIYICICICVYVHMRVSCLERC